MSHFQEAGRSLCGALLDYSLPNSAQRESFFRGSTATETLSADLLYQAAASPARVSNDSLRCDRHPAVTSNSSHAEVLQGIGRDVEEDSDVDAEYLPYKR